MSRYNKNLGDLGEVIAKARYADLGFEIIAVKKRTPSGEIDIIAAKDGFYHFVEVKTRSNTKLGNPEESITPRRHARMITCAEEYAAEHEIPSFQIDVVAIILSKNHEPEIVVFENI